MGCDSRVLIVVESKLGVLGWTIAAAQSRWEQ